MREINQYNSPKYRSAMSYIFPALIMVMISLIPWSEILLSATNKMLWDREIYAQKIITGDSVLNYFEYDTLSSYFTAEYTWEFLIKMIQDGLVPVDHTVFFQIISTIWVVSAGMILYRHGGYFSLPLIANPLVFDLAYSQLRSALAVSILYIIYLVRPKSNLIAIAFCLFAATIHTSMLIFLAIYVLCSATADEGGKLSGWSKEVRLALVVGAGLAVGLMIGPLRGSILTFVGDRRAEYADASSGLLYMSFWVILFGIFLQNYRETFRSLEGRFTLCVLALVFVNIFTSFYSLRFLAMFYPFAIAAIMMSRPAVRIPTLVIFLIYMAAQWYYYLNTLNG